MGEGEALACLFACERWHIYLWGTRSTLRTDRSLRTDHQAVVALLAAGKSSRCPLHICRWSTRLMYYDFNIEYCKGSENRVADALSRLPLQNNNSTTLDEEIVSLITTVVDKQTVQAAIASNETLPQGWPQK